MYPSTGRRHRRKEGVCPTHSLDLTHACALIPQCRTRAISGNTGRQNGLYCDISNVVWFGVVSLRLFHIALYPAWVFSTYYTQLSALGGGRISWCPDSTLHTPGSRQLPTRVVATGALGPFLVADFLTPQMGLRNKMEENRSPAQHMVGESFRCRAHNCPARKS